MAPESAASCLFKWRKIWDSPRAFEAPGKYNAITLLFMGHMAKKNLDFMFQILK
jgi:hypothetical protein